MWPEKIGYTGAGAIALGLGAGGAFIRIGFALIVLACLLEVRKLWSAARKDTLIWVGMFYAAYLLFSYLVHGGSTAERNHGDLFSSLVHTGLLAIALGWVLRGNASAMKMFVLLFYAGLGIALIKWLTIADIHATLAGERMHLGLGANGTGVYFGTALLGVVVMGVLTVPTITSGLRKWFFAFCFFAAGLIVAVPFVLNQSRSAWLAFLLVSIPGAVSLFWKRRIFLPHASLRSVAPLLVLMVLGMFSMLAFKNVIDARLGQEQAVLAQWAAGSAEVPDSSVGYRIKLWEAGDHAFLERPFTGYGVGSARELIESGTGLSQFPHFHNLYIQVAVETGIVGVLGFVLVSYFLLKALYLAWRGGYVEDWVIVFLFGAWFFYFIISLFQIRHDDIHGMAYLSILMGLSYTNWMHRTSGSYAPAQPRV